MATVFGGDRKVRAGVVGATGYAGAELVSILAGHPHVELTVLTSRQYAGRPIADVYPALSGVVDMVCQPYEVDLLAELAEVVFLSLPHQLSMSFVPELLDRGLRVIDLSADFRFSDPELYESVYQAHTAPDLLQETVYGLSEVFAESIRNARLVGNPGCYPTSVLLPLVPLLGANLVTTGSIIADAKSGVSGAGRSLSLPTHYCEVVESFRPYSVAVHRHAPEMAMVASGIAGRPVHITFVPHLVPMSRGMQTTLYVMLEAGVDRSDIEACLKAAYDDAPFVRLTPEHRPPDAKHVRHTNFCDIGFVIEPATNRLILMSAIDNLVKGAAGQAVQNMNLMTGLPETAGLSHLIHAIG